jgi:hypothetical protein
MVGERVEAVLLQDLGDLLGAFSRRAVDDAALGLARA